MGLFLTAKQKHKNASIRKLCGGVLKGYSPLMLQIYQIYIYIYVLQRNGEKSLMPFESRGVLLCDLVSFIAAVKRKPQKIYLFSPFSDIVDVVVVFRD